MYTVRFATGASFGTVIMGPRTDDPEGVEISQAQYDAISAEKAAGRFLITIDENGTVSGQLDLMAARLSMADAFAALPDQVRADHLQDYLACEHAIIRGDVSAARKRIETMTVSLAIPEAEREQLRARFLALFPALPNAGNE